MKQIRDVFMRHLICYITPPTGIKFHVLTCRVGRYYLTTTTTTTTTTILITERLWSGAPTVVTLLLLLLLQHSSKAPMWSVQSVDDASCTCRGVASEGGGGPDPPLFATTWFQNITSLKHDVCQRSIVKAVKIAVW